MNVRPGKYATFGALINDTRDDMFDPKLQPGDAYVIELDGGTDVAGNEIHADDMVMYNGQNWLKVIDVVVNDAQASEEA